MYKFALFSYSNMSLLKEVFNFFFQFVRNLLISDIVLEDTEPPSIIHILNAQTSYSTSFVIQVW